jgi:hypothetical protein
MRRPCLRPIARRRRRRQNQSPNRSQNQRSRGRRRHHRPRLRPGTIRLGIGPLHPLRRKPLNPLGRTHRNPHLRKPTGRRRDNRRRNPHSLPGRPPPLRRGKASRRRSRRNRTGRILRRPAPIHAEPVRIESRMRRLSAAWLLALAVGSRHVLHSRHCGSAQRRKIDAVQPPCRGAARPRERSAGCYARPPGRGREARRSIV